LHNKKSQTFGSAKPKRDLETLAKFSASRLAAVDLDAALSEIDQLQLPQKT
jgi:hypothetical protein